MTPQEKRIQRLQLQDDQIGQALRESEANGELRAAPSYGRPMPPDDPYDATPDSLRLPYKILKDAGLVPPEVQVMREITALQQALEATDDPSRQRSLQQAIAEKRQHLALRLERLRLTGGL